MSWFIIVFGCLIYTFGVLFRHFLKPRDVIFQLRATL
jgi:hypothetical protein